VPEILTVRNLVKSFGDLTAVNNVNFNIEDEFFALLGPSGSGKTTTLRMIAGLEIPDLGIISLEGNEITTDPPEKRNINTVFQNYALFPHMTVFENVENRQTAQTAVRWREAADCIDSGVDQQAESSPAG